MNRKDISLGIDIGGTNTAFGFVDKDGMCVIESTIPTCSNEPAEMLLKRLFKEADALYKTVSDEYNLIGIGIGAPNANYFKGTVEQPPNLNWGVVNILAIVKEYYDVPSAITNDANAAAIGEMQFGAAKGMKDFVVITLGTGLGSGIVVNGQLVYGADSFAGEIGHTIVDPSGRECGCGRKGCLEAYASATGLRRTVYELIATTNTPSRLRDICFNQLTAKEICAAAKSGDTMALEAFDYTAKVLGLKLADTVAHLSPEAIILFGGLALAGDLILAPTKHYMEEFLLPIFRNKVKILPSALHGGNAAVLGAAALIWNEIKIKNKF